VRWVVIWLFPPLRGLNTVPVNPHLLTYVLAFIMQPPRQRSQGRAHALSVINIDPYTVPIPVSGPSTRATDRDTARAGDRGTGTGRGDQGRMGRGGVEYARDADFESEWG